MCRLYLGLDRALLLISADRLQLSALSLSSRLPLSARSWTEGHGLRQAQVRKVLEHGLVLIYVYTLMARAGFAGLVKEKGKGGIYEETHTQSSEVL